MALHTLEGLNGKTADYIRYLTNQGFKIDPCKSVSDDPHIFNVALFNKDTNRTVEICTKEDSNSFTRSFNMYCSLGGGFGQRFSVPYYKVHDNIYADSKEEADREYKKWLVCNYKTTCSENSIQAFADKLGEAISNYLSGDSQ